MSVELHHRLDGPSGAPVLVLSNSLGTALGMWDDQLPALADQFRVLRYDQRGHGRTPAPPGPYTVAELGRDALALLDRLVLCCTSAHLPPREMWTERAATVRAQGMEAVVDAALERWFTPALAECRPEALERIRRALLDMPAEGYAGCCEAIAAHDLRQELGSIRAPTLVLAAADDPATPPEHGRLIANSIDGARFVALERARHLAVVERPKESTRELLGHLTAEAIA